jgi:hypothetical protein
MFYHWSKLCRPACSVAVTVIGGTTWAAWSPLLNDAPKPLGAANTAWRITPQRRPGTWTLLEQWRKSTQKYGRRAGMREVPSVYILTFYFIFWIKCNKVHIPAGIMTRLQAGWPRSQGLTPVGPRDISLLHNGHTSFGAHPDSCVVGNRGCFPGGEMAVAWSWPLTFT